MSASRVILLLILAFVFVAVTSVGTGIYSVNRIQHELAETEGFHTKALYELLTINETISESVQESMAYVVSGDEGELDDYQKLINSLDSQLDRFATIARLDRPGEEAEHELFLSIQAKLTTLQTYGAQMIVEYKNTGELSDETFQNYEQVVDDIGKTMNRLIKIEETEVEEAQVSALAAISDSRSLIVLQSIFTLIAATFASIFAARILRKIFAARDLAEKDARIAGLTIDSADVGVIFVDSSLPEQPITNANPGFEKITGYSKEEIIGRNCRFLQGPDSNSKDIDKIRNALSAQEPVRVTIENYKKDGEKFWNDLSIFPVRESDGKSNYFVGILNDLTERISLEQRLQQAQKMEAVGQLAGGIAHDFNNYLTVVNGAAELLQSSSGADTDFWARQILDAGERASALTRQLLATARQQVLELRDLNVNEAVSKVSPFLRNTIGEHINLEFKKDPAIGIVNMDPSQLEQVIFNLVLNARDAMPNGGTVTIETGDVMLSEEYVKSHPDTRAGRHTMLAISDTGTGIDPKIADKIFDPFVTTKNPGEGTGLGLATVFGIIKQAGGIINVYSEPGIGATFKIYFRCADSDNDTSVPEARLPTLRGEGTILLVEDDKMVRQVTKAILESLGFTVEEAEDGIVALEQFRKLDDIRLLLTDVTMPNMGGVELAIEARKLRPDTNVLYMSGYTRNGIVHHGLVDPGHILMQKPFTRADLIRKLHRALGD